MHLPVVWCVMRNRLAHTLLIVSLSLAWLQALRADQVSSVSESIELSESIQPRSEGAYWFYKSVYFEAGKPCSNGITKKEVIRVRELDGTLCWQLDLQDSLVSYDLKQLAAVKDVA